MTMMEEAPLSATKSTPAIERVRWKFRVGDKVDHVLGGMPSVIAWQGLFIETKYYGLIDSTGAERMFLERALKPQVA